MLKRLMWAAFATALASSCSPECQDFSSSAATQRDQTARLGIGFQDTLTVGQSSGPVVQDGTLPPGMTLEVANGKILITGTPTTAGEYQANLTPKGPACAVNGSTLGNVVLALTVVPAQCEDGAACRLLGTTACTQSSSCVAGSGSTAACARTVADAGVCISVNGPLDTCSGAVAAGPATTVEGTSVQTCLATPPITGCNHHVCAGAP